MIGTELPILNVLPDPILVVERSGRVRACNTAADRLFGRPAAGLLVSDLAGDEPEPVAEVVRRMARSSAPTIAAITLAGGDDRRFKAWGRRLSHDDGAVVLRIQVDERSAFSVLSDKIADLNQEIARRRRTQAVLEEALRHNQLLLRELNHRVKNNIQMLAALFAARLRKPGPPELHGFLESAIQRMMVIGSAQRIMYEGGSPGSIPLERLLADVLDVMKAIVPPGVDLTIDCAAADIHHDQAHAVALIVNELATNALKHGVRSGGRVRVGSFHRDGEIVVFVEDDGPGMDVDAAGSQSGLSLVRGLARQIGGKVRFDTTHGLRCEVSFAPPAVSGVTS